MRVSNTEYDEFFGAPRVAEVYDWTRRRWRRVIIRQPKTPNDRVTAASGDEQLQPGRLPRPDKRGVNPGPTVKTKMILEQFKETLRRGPCTLAELAEVVGIPYGKVKGLMDTYRQYIGAEKRREGRQRLYWLPQPGGMGTPEPATTGGD